MSLRMGALGLIAQNPDSSGYDLLKTFNQTLANVWPATQSQLYGELNRLTADGLVEVASRGARGRKNYRITPAGRQRLAAWLTEPDTDPSRNPFLLRVFLLSEVDPEAAREMLERASLATRTRLDHLNELTETVPWEPTAPDAFSRMALEYGRRVLSAEADWLNWAAEQIPRSAPAHALERQPEGQIET